MSSLLVSKINELGESLGLSPQLSQLDGNVERLPSLSSLLPQNDSILFSGDNIKYLLHFARVNHAIIDLCYIDPPYNTGSNFCYHDNRKSGYSNFFGKHSEWMSFMLPRIFAAREMLKDSGLMAISIDDYEYAHLKILMDRVFGEENFIGNVIVCRSRNGKGSRRNIAPNHEYLLVYGKSQNSQMRGEKDDASLYDKRDQHGNYRIDGLFRKKGDASLRSDRPNMFYPLYFNRETGQVSIDKIQGWNEVLPIDSKGVERRWLWGVDTARDRAWQLYASKNGVVYVKNYSGNNGEKRIKLRTVWDDPAFYTERGTNEIKKIFGSKVFDTPKPLEYIKKIVDVMAQTDAVVMDFFAGSGTTAHAVAELNATDAGTRKTILMESNAVIKDTHTACRAGYKTISEITLARFDKIRSEYPNFKSQKYDLGSSDFKLC
ncbi:site-specific DNA-methyltransferase [Chromobacterium subtsugae]|uniref:site-specific DNA-methyltransferase n=1 Tax=Chromobacterium subtsugae TaxID=251747 RepID=UPI0009BB0EA2|nr:site-specific DNA-methyltransferase [Chromobacterium subtsugae]